MSWPGILHLQPPLDEAFQQIARLRNDTQGGSDRDGTPGGGVRQHMGSEQPSRNRGDQAADRTRPGLARRDARRQARPADAAPDQIGADVAGPDDQQQKQHIGAAGDGIMAQPQQRRPSQRNVAKAEGAQRCPAGAAAQAQPFRREAEHRGGDDDGANVEESVATGIVLTGGTSKMEGAIELAEEVFHMPVRLGVPQYVSGLVDVVSNPIHATGVGLLLYAKSNLEQQRAAPPLLSGSVQSIFERMKNWFQGNF